MSLIATFLASNDGYTVFGVFVSRSLISWIIIGLIAGWLAGTIARGRGFGCFVNILLGMVGAVLGGWIFSKLGIYSSGTGWLYSLAAATVGAIVLVTIARLFSGGRDDD
jgi:uncharacterized membrane protein YeaQ/YmgE (transglycosylase-associated protein family)